MLDDTLNNFGMSNLRLENSLKQVERNLKISLRARQPTDGQIDKRYYPQFEAQLRHMAEQMAEYYQVFYCLENSIRTLVSSRLSEGKGPGWWDECVQPRIRQDVSDRIQRELDMAVSVRSPNPIDYTTFGELQQIISVNWAWIAWRSSCGRTATVSGWRNRAESPPPADWI